MIAHGWELAWRSGLASVDTSSTKALFRCLGGDKACVSGASRSSCGKYQTGALCSTCDAGFYKDDDTCVACGDVSRQDALLLLFYSACLLALLVLPRHFAVFGSADIGFYRSCKIVVSYLQVCSVLGLVLDMPLETLVPASAKITALSKVLWGNIKPVLAHCRCVGFDHLSVWAIEVIIVPVCMVTGLWLAYKWSSWRTPDRKLRFLKDLKQRLSLGLFLFYPTICSEIFSLMQCRSLSDDESWLRADMSVPCAISSNLSQPESILATQYGTYLQLAYVLAIPVPFGVPLALGLHFFREARKDKKEFVEQTEMIIQDSEDDLMTSTHAGTASDVGANTAAELTYLRLMRSYSSLISDFKPDFFYLELVDFLRKAIFTGALLFAEQGSVEQLFIGIFVALGFFVLQVVASPFKRTAHNWLKIVELLCLLSTFLVCLVIRVNGRQTGDEGYDRFLDEESIRQGAAMREQQWQQRVASDLAAAERSKELDASSDSSSDSGRTSSSAVAATQKQRKLATEKRNALALEHQRSREAQRIGSSADSN